MSGLHPSVAVTVLLLALAGLFRPTPTAAQAILNTERFQLSEVSGLHVSANLALSGQRGNRKVLDIRSSGIVGVLTDRHWTRLIFGGRYFSNEQVSILDDRFAQLRYSYIVSPRVQTFHFVQAQRTETLRLRSRWLVGSGIRRTMIRTERASIAVGTGLMGEWEEHDRGTVAPGESSERRALRMTNLAVASWEFESGARLLNILYYQPDVADFGDLRLLNDLGLIVPLNAHVRLTLSAEWRRDTRPPGELRADDLSFSMGLGVDVR